MKTIESERHSHQIASQILIILIRYIVHLDAYKSSCFRHYTIIRPFDRSRGVADIVSTAAVCFLTILLLTDILLVTYGSSGPWIQVHPPNAHTH